MKITIPASIGEATEALTGVERLLTAKQWERAAIVAAFVEVGNKPGPSSRNSERTHLTPVEFAALGISGLKSDNTVRFYVNTWLAERPRPKPGDIINLDGLGGWPPQKTTTQNLAGNTAAIAEALTDPAVRQRVLDRADTDTKHSLSVEATKSVAQDIATKNGGRTPTEDDVRRRHDDNPLTPVIDRLQLEANLFRALDGLEAAIRAWGPTPLPEEFDRRLFAVQMREATK